MQLWCAESLTHGQINEILQLRTESPSLGLAALLDRLELDEKNREEAEGQLTDGSMCHSLWVIARGQQRSWHELAVRQVRHPVAHSQKDKPAGKSNVPVIDLYRFQW